VTGAPTPGLYTVAALAGMRAVKLFQLFIGVHDHRQLLLDGAQLAAKNREVRLIVGCVRVDAIADSAETGGSSVRVEPRFAAIVATRSISRAVAALR
jgi:hypothetical protein